MTKKETSTPGKTESGGILKINITGGDANVLGYPPKIRGLFDIICSRPCLETLTRWNEQGEYVPWLADSWTTDASSKTVILKLKKGIKFQDDTDFNAAAVKWNIEKFIEAGRKDIPPIASIEIQDDYTLKFTLVEWDNRFVSAVGIQQLISPSAWKNAPGATTDQERDDWACNNPVGTGPFRLVSWEKGTKQVYEKFDDYWQDGKPYLDGIELHFIADSMTASAAFQAREVDVIWNIPVPMAKQLDKAGYNIVEMKTGLGNIVNALIPNSANPDSPFTNLKLRQALSYAIDRQAICDSVFSGYALPVEQWAMPGSVWEFPDYKGYPYDPGKARQLVVEAGYPDGINVKLLTLSMPDFQTMATAIQAMLAKVGIHAEMDVADIGRFVEVTTAPKQWESLVINGLFLDPNPCFSMSGLLGSNGRNAGMMHPEEVDALLDKVVKMPDQESTIETVRKIHQLVLEKYCLFTPIEVGFTLAAKHSYVKDDGMCTIMINQWTPEDGKLIK